MSGPRRPVPASAGLLSRLSLRIKLTGAFVLLVLSSAAISTWLGNSIVTNAMLDVTERRVHTGLEAADLMVQGDIGAVRRSVSLASQAHRILNPLRERQPEALPELLSGLRGEHGLDILAFVDRSSRRVVNSTPPPDSKPDPGPATPPAFVDGAWAGDCVAGIEVMTRDELAAHAPTLAQRASTPLSSVPRETPSTRTELHDGLVMVAACPVRVDGAFVGVIYGGVLLNRTTALVDRIRRGVFGGETHEGREVGTASIFLEDTRIATNVLLDDGERAVGTRCAADVANAVLHDGQEWRGRAFVVHDWYVTAYRPLRDHTGRIVGMLYVGMREGPYMAVRTRMMLSFLIVVVAGLAIMLGFTWVITKRMIHPLADVVAASRRVAAGDLESGVPVTSGDELGQLAISFNQMVASLNTMKRALEESAHTLEERVRQRTSELAAIQTQMAQSERLASLGRMAAGVAHEINNPLGGILTFAMLAQEDTSEDHPLRKNIDIIVRQTLRCRDIVRGLLDFARQSDSVASWTDVNSVVDSTLPLLEQQASFHNIRTVPELAPELPRVLIDPGQLQQVVLNLALNAVDAMDAAGALTLRTRYERATNRVLLDVADQGKGIPDDILPLIFEPFFTTKEVGKGTGLGLAIVHGIVTRAGGEIAVATSPGGTTFTVSLPASAESVSAEAARAPEAPPGTDS